MNDDWNLKDKIASGMMGQDCVYMKDIEILRQKLIKDINEVFRETWMLDISEMERCVEEVINKRFGYEEEI